MSAVFRTPEQHAAAIRDVIDFCVKNLITLPEVQIKGNDLQLIFRNPDTATQFNTRVVEISKRMPKPTEPVDVKLSEGFTTEQSPQGASGYGLHQAGNVLTCTPPNALVINWCARMTTPQRAPEESRLGFMARVVKAALGLGK